MTLGKIGAWESPVSAEADRPARTARDMKAVFDANSNQIREAFNALCDALELAASTVRKDEAYPNRYLSLDGSYTTPAVGESANGVRAGGEAGQVYVKASAADYDGAWLNIRPACYEAEIPVSAWAGGTTCTLSLPGKGIAADTIVFVSPLEDSLAAWTAAGARCTGCEPDTLLFGCDETPEAALSFTLIVWNY